MTKERILFCGSTEWIDRKPIRRALEHFDPASHIIVHGAARGADTIAEEEARALGFETDPHPANWRPNGKLDRGAGLKRNIEMLESGVVFVCAFNLGTSGTNHTIREAKKRGIEGVEVRPAKLDTVRQF